MSPILDSIGSAKGYGWGSFLSSNSFESIATIDLSSGGQPSVTFSSIPSTYKHLQIRGIAKNSEYYSASASVSFTFNGDTGSNYSNHSLYGNGSNALADGSATRSDLYFYSVPRSYPGREYMFGAFIIDILDYADTNKYKTTRTLSGFNTNGQDTPYLGVFSGNWRSTSAINSITLTSYYLNHAQYSTFALYGIKGA